VAAAENEVVFVQVFVAGRFMGRVRRVDAMRGGRSASPPVMLASPAAFMGRCRGATPWRSGDVIGVLDLETCFAHALM